MRFTLPSQMVSRRSVLSVCVDAGIALILTMLSVDRASAQDSWAIVASDPNPKTSPAVAEINGLIYVYGFDDPNGNQSSFAPRLSIYNPALNTWTTGAAPGLIRTFANAGVINGRLYVVGGCVYSDCRIGTTNALEIYNPGTNTWSNGTPMGTPRWGAAAGVIAGKLYVTGGTLACPPCATTHTTEVYDPAANSWTTRATIPTSRELAIGAVVDGLLYVIGGYQRGSVNAAVGTVDAYDPLTNTWSSRSPMPIFRSGAAGGVINGHIYVVGGANTTRLTVNESYDPESDTWTERAPMFTARQYTSGGVVNSRLYVIDGFNVSPLGANEEYALGAAPTVTQISPTSGKTTGGTSVTITGTGFAAGATVTIGGVAATSVTVVSATSITAVTGARGAGAVDVVVANTDGQSGTRAGAFTYVAAPSLSSISPSSGKTAGGTAVTLTGTGFLAGATVTIGGVPATSVTVVSSTSITAATGAHAAGAVDVVVANSDAQTTLAGAFTYVAPPALSSISPSSGKTAGGTAVTLTGTGFLAGATVTIGGVPATSVTVVSSTSITAVTGAHAAGAVDVVVANADGQSVTFAGAFTYVPPPTLSSISPTSGTTGGGTAVTVTGTAFRASATVTIGGVAATSVTVVSATNITAVTGAHAAGAVDVVVANTDGQSVTLAGAFTYVLPTLALTPGTIIAGVVNNAGTLQFATPPQTLTLTQNGAGGITWTAAASESWVTVSPSSGNGVGTLAVSINNTLGVLPASGTRNATITITATGASNNPQASVALTIVAPAQATPPNGTMDTPTPGQSGITGSLAVTGWAVDDMGVSRVRLLRDPVAGEGVNLIFIGDAVFVRGARPDVATANPNAPRNDQAGWGYLLLTNFLPNQGNGTFTLSAYADDVEGNTRLIGSKTITCANSGATAPFGAIDTPAQGATVSGTAYLNFGWALAGQPTGRSIPIDGATIQVFIDSVSIGAIESYNNARSDIQALFPGYLNTNGAVGFRTLNTTMLSNGVHTIAWVVTDNLGAAAGIGSRFFTVSNSSLYAGSMTAGSGPVAQGFSPASIEMAYSGARRVALRADAGPVIVDVRTAILGSARSLDSIDRSFAIIGVRRGYDVNAEMEFPAPDPTGLYDVRVAALDRVVVDLNPQRDDRTTYRGYAIDGEALRALPVGSRLDERTGEFAWAPAIGFSGSYDLVFVKTTKVAADEAIRIRVTVR